MRIGRPSLPVTVRKRNNVTFRIRDALKAEIMAAAEENGRSLSEEIEFRLEMSFRNEANALACDYFGAVDG